MDSINENCKRVAELVVHAGAVARRLVDSVQEEESERVLDPKEATVPHPQATGSSMFGSVLSTPLASGLMRRSVVLDGADDLLT